MSVEVACQEAVDVYEEIDVWDESRDNQNPLVAQNHVTEAVNLTPRDTHHCKENARIAVGWFGQSFNATLHNAVVDGEGWQERTDNRNQICGHQMQGATEHEQTQAVCTQVPDIGVRKWVDKMVI